MKYELVIKVDTETGRCSGEIFSGGKGMSAASLSQSDARGIFRARQMFEEHLFGVAALGFLVDSPDANDNTN